MNISTVNHTAITLPCMSPEENMDAVIETVARVAFAANLLFGLPTNVYVLWLIVRGRQAKLASDFVPLNQIMIEILLCLYIILYFMTLCLSYCLLVQLSLFLYLLPLIMRPLVQGYICLEQYLATVHPVIFLRFKPLRYKVASCCVSWLIGIMLSIAGVVLDLQRNLFFLTAALYIFFFLLMCFCCFSVLRVLKRPAPGEGQRDQHRGDIMKKKAFKIILINLVYSAVFQLPMTFVLSLYGAIPYHLVLAFSCVNICTFVITGFVPPLLYLYRVGRLEWISVFIYKMSLRNKS